MPKLSFIVSTFNRPAMLPVALHSLAAQTFTDFEVIVTDNSLEQQANRELIEGMDKRFCHIDTSSLPGSSPYHSAEYAVKDYATGEFLCFPSDDSYYVPCFAEIMIEATKLWDLVYCDMVYDARFNGNCYAAVNVQPIVNCIDKTGFILRRSWFDEFPGKVIDGPCKADGELIEQLLRQGIKHGKVPGLLMVHN
jgi:glycosyltransferase involved in cell wall biosynthesis